MKNIEKISPSDKIIEKLKEKKILKKVLYSDFVERCDLSLLKLQVSHIILFKMDSRI